jgi:uncharacterized protein (UPF0276 family)
VVEVSELSRDEKIKYFCQKIDEWLRENELPLTMENIRRFFDLKYRKIPREKAIKDIYECMRKLAEIE